VLFARELDAILRAHPGRLEVVHRLDDTHGFVDAAVVHGVVTDTEADCYLCGPTPFMDTVERALLVAGVPQSRIRVERFVSASDAPRTFTAVRGDVVPGAITVTLHGKRSLVPYESGKSILRAALDAGLEAPYSCEDGFCGCCVAQVCEGSVEMAADDALTEDEKKRGLVLTCQARPRTAVCAVEYPKGV
jgi:3-ketosteroid 9alpha-monooxygenase subunit B